MNIHIHCDGLCSPNDGSGTGTWAFVCFDENELKFHEECGVLLSPTTNNLAEYQGMIMALKYIDEKLDGVKVNLYCDSELVINQVEGKWNCKSEKLIPKRNRAQELYEAVKDRARIYFVKGTENRADQLTRDVFFKETGKHPIDYSTWKKKR